MRRSPAIGVTVGVIILGLLHGLSFAPTAFWWLQILSFAGLCAVVLNWPQRAVSSMAWFSLACFCAGLSWLFISMNRYGGMPAPMAALAVVLLSAYLSVFCALAAWLARRLLGNPAAHPIAFALVLGGIWTLAEIVKGVFLTGFPWLSVGYAHIDGPFAAFAPWVGVYGLGGLAVMTGALIGALGWSLLRKQSESRPVLLRATSIVLAVVALAVLAVLAHQPEFATPDGKPVSVRLVQGNVPQGLKFRQETALKAIRDYVSLVTEGTAQLNLIPETAWVVPLAATPEPIMNKLLNHLKQHNAMFSVGVPARTTKGLTNSVITIDSSAQIDSITAINLYSKRHLVPFGEFVPFGFQWFVDMMHIPLGNFDRGTSDQAQLDIDGRLIAFNICYEDLFGEELAVQVRDGAGVLANVSNLAWFGDSHALSQHLSIARMRTLELRRPMIRSTNTGVTAHIDADGTVLARLPANTQRALDVLVQPMSGLTPYARLGLFAPLALGFGLLIVGFLTSQIGRRSME